MKRYVIDVDPVINMCDLRIATASALPCIGEI
jgi:hypothetical protein